MKKFQLQITIEQKQSWRMSQIENAGNPPDSAKVETDSLLPAEKTKNCSPVVYRKPSLFQSFSGYLSRFIKILRLAGRKEK
jgi:hypothetical protein